MKTNNSRLIRQQKKLLSLVAAQNSPPGLSAKEQKKITRLMDKIHCCLEAPAIDTAELEYHIIQSFWETAYQKYHDGGYISNDAQMCQIRFDYETQLLEKILRRHVASYQRAIDICCGNGRYSFFFDQYFDTTIGLDLSGKQIRDNSMRYPQIRFVNENFITMKDKNKLGTFDFVYVSDIFTYTQDKDIPATFNALKQMLKPGGVLVIRESCRILGRENYASYRYVAYYRNRKFYEKGIFRENFVRRYRNFAYNLYNMDRVFRLFPKLKKQIQNHPAKLKPLVKKYISPNHRSCYFYVYQL